jgi:hypothetical protein
VIVWLVDRTTGVERYTESSSEGFFTFSLLHPGTYDIRAEQLGYLPKNIQDVRIGAGAEVTLTIVLESAEPPVTVIDTVAFGGAPPDAAPGGAHAFPYATAERLPLVDRGVDALTALDTRSLETLGVDGLPDRLSVLAVDGAVHQTAQHPFLPKAGLETIAFPRLAFQGASVLSSRTDLEWDGAAGSLLSTYSRRGSRKLSVSLFADWRGKLGAGSDYFDPNLESRSSFRGGAVVGGPIIADTAHFLIGAEAQRLQVPRASAWISTPFDSAVVAVAQDSFGVDVGSYVGPRVVERELISAFGRFDWDFSQRHRASAWVSFATVKDDEAAVGPGGILGIGAEVEGTDIVATGTVLSSLSDRVSNELRLGFETSTRDYAANQIPGTRVGSLGIAFGTDPAQPGSFERTAATASDALQVQLGAVRIKLGISAGFVLYDETYAFGQDGVFWFGDPDGFAAGRGAFLGASGSVPSARFSTLSLSGLLQNTWTVASGLDLRFGLRWDGEWLPSDEITGNDEWLALTGIANDSIDGFLSRWSPRFGFRWAIGSSAEWLVQGSAAVYQGALDPTVLAEVIRENGRTEVSRGIGAVGWPAGDGSAVAPVGMRLTVLGPEFQDPRSTRLSFGIGRRLGRAGLLEVSTHYRHTDFLPRRHDVNRLPGGTARDQYGRPIYAELAKEGGIVAGSPSAPHRFEGFETVSALDVDGYSDSWGITGRLEQPLGRFLRLLASYTYSQTTDNWPANGGGSPYGQLSPFPDSLNGSDWVDGVSDFDVPHRAAVGAELRPLGRDGFTLAALYRYRAGMPFTPGFPAGVDVNGDGSWSNDPAFVDDEFPGIADVLLDWECLRIQAGEFAERNACRDPGLSTLDLRFGLGPFRFGGYPLELWLEVLNVTDADLVVRNHALFLVDPGVALVEDAAAGTVTVPLQLNENFGQPVAYRGFGRAMRLGLRVNY